MSRPTFGTPAPWFCASVLDGNYNYAFDTVAGRAVIVFFMGSVRIPAVKAALDALLVHVDRFDDSLCCFFGVTTDPEDASSGRVKTRIPGIRYILDYDRAVSIAYGACRAGSDLYEPYIVVLDQQLRVAGHFTAFQAREAVDLAQQLSDENRVDGWAPALLVPRILEPEICQKLMDLYEEGNSEDSGFMREISGKTVSVIDHNFKRRSDLTIEDDDLRRSLSVRVRERLRPLIWRAFNFDATRMERYIVACYDSAVRGYFRAHRDNTTRGTAHRRFAVTINLNHQFDGGELRFPEFGSRIYRVPPGGAIVFACGLLHEALPVTRGRRFAFLPFLYDDAAAALREENNPYLGEGIEPYRQN